MLSHAHRWDHDDSQLFVSLNPSHEEVSLIRCGLRDRSYFTEKIAVRSDIGPAQCLAYAPSANQRGLVATGHSNGIVSLFSLTDKSLPLVRLRPKQARPCNSVSFSVSGLVAVGLDKVRNDNSLQVWNVERIASASAQGNARIGSSNTINVDSAIDSSVLDNPDAYRTPLNTYLPNEVVSSVCFLHQSPNSLLCGTYKVIRELDMRSPAPSFQCPTKCSLGITLNPFDDNVFASYSDDGAIALWDRRNLHSDASLDLVEPELYMTRLFSDSGRKSSLSSLCYRFSLSHHNEFSLLNDGNMLRRCQTGATLVGASDPALAPVAARPSSSAGNTAKDEPTASTFLASVLDVPADYDRVVSFDYSPDLRISNKFGYVCLRQSGQVFHMNVIESPDAIVFDPDNGVTIVEPERISIVDNVNSPGKMAAAMRSRSDSVARSSTQDDIDDDVDDDVDDDDDDQQDSQDNRAVADLSKAVSDHKLTSDSHSFMSPAALLSRDISSKMRIRAQQGYAFDCRRNLEILEEEGDALSSSKGLRYAWNWLTQAVESDAKHQMRTIKLDLGYEGVLGIWEGRIGMSGQRRQLVVNSTSSTGSGTTATTTSSSTTTTDDDKSMMSTHAFNEIVQDLVAKSDKLPYIAASVQDSARVANRQLCLRIAGWGFGLDELESRLQALEAEGKHEQAAGWAVFHGDVQRAVKSLASSSRERARILAPAVSAYMAYKNDTTNSPWRDQCRRMASELPNAYLRAIMAFVADGSWLDVLDEVSLPLVEELGIALRFLPDDELSVYLQRITDRAVRNGDLEGIILTGLTPRVVSLVQSYVDKTSDVQSASLILSYGAPRYFLDHRIRHWVEEYRRLLNSWKMFRQRAKFDVKRTALSEASKRRVELMPVPPQMYIQCNKCKKEIGPLAKPEAAPAPGPKALTRQKPKFRSGYNGLVSRCGHCNAQLPRCAVCHLPLGSAVMTEGTVLTHDAAIDLHKFEHWPTFCLTCGHGLHAGHAKEWFSKHDICPVPDCNCLCDK